MDESKQVEFSFIMEENKYLFVISDQGEGFDWQEYLRLTSARGQSSHGRGIAVAITMSMLNVEYHAPGNEVRVSLLPSSSVREE